MASAANLVAPRPGEPVFAEAVPSEVTVAFHAHDNVEGLLGNFLTAVTHGLVSSGQRELALTMRLGNREQPVAKMLELVRFFTTVHVWAQQGNVVDEGGFTQFGERGLFERAHCGLLYSDARAIKGVDFPERALAAIFVDAQEIRAALDYGAYRVLTRIGAQLRLFPFPTWGALDRPSAVTARESESILAKVARMRVRGASFLVADQCLRVTIPSDAKHLSSGVPALPAGAPFALLTRPAAGANAILLWRPGQTEMVGISPDGSDGSRLSGSFLMVAPGEGADRACPIEDGYSLLLSNESRVLFSSALAAQRPLSLVLSGGMRLELEWQPERS